MYLPLLITVQWSAIAFISFNLWVIIITDLPSLVKFLMIFIKSSISCGVKTAFGSSSINISAPLYRAFNISTLCCIPTDISSTFAIGSIDKPYLLDISSTSFIALFISKVPINLVVSLPKIMFCATVKVPINMKCWWTIPIPLLIATLGFSILTNSSFIWISPEVGVYNPYKMFIRVDLPAPFSPKSACTSPLCTVKLMLSLATKSPNFLVIFFICILLWL